MAVFEPPPDEVLRAVLDGRPVRIVLATTSFAAREAARRHAAAPAAALALARAATAGLLLATLTKDDERVTLQVLGDGPLGGVTVDATAAGRVRAYVKNPEAPLLPAAGARASLARAIGHTGVVSVIRDLGLGQPFSGSTAIRSGEIDEDVERYLEESEQVVSALAADALFAPDGTIALAAGLLVQALPGSDGADAVAEARALVSDGALARVLGAGIDDGQLHDAEGLLAAVLGDRLGRIELLDRRPVLFQCACSRARAGASLASLGESELAAMILDEGKAEVTCNFCRERYEFDEAELERIRRETAKQVGPPS
ncbi:MAG TPA: Hsp33 family molecular chaperone HslO [Polyangia bacterium]|nr:Hsp33 family molecular chaperone HslO [Polyangia bacterium]